MTGGKKEEEWREACFSSLLGSVSDSNTNLVGTKRTHNKAAATVAGRV